MSALGAAAVIGAGFAAGAVNTIVGAGSLITYPTMVFMGVPAVTANIANSVGLVPGSVTGAWAYRHELRGQNRAIWRLVPMSMLGAVAGAALLTHLPNTAFKVIVPVLVLFATVLVAIAPRLNRSAPGSVQVTRWGPLGISVLLASVYGGYFSAAQGVILLGVMGIFMSNGLQEQNALKNLLQLVVNVVAACFFVAEGRVDWGYAALVALGAVVGAPVGAALARRVPAKPFRVGIVVFGLVMTAILTIMTLT